jgi:hypothetical protein
MIAGLPLLVEVFRQDHFDTNDGRIAPGNSITAVQVCDARVHNSTTTAKDKKTSK